MHCCINCYWTYLNNMQLHSNMHKQQAQTGSDLYRHLNVLLLECSQWPCYYAICLTLFFIDDHGVQSLDAKRIVKIKKILTIFWILKFVIIFFILLLLIYFPVNLFPVNSLLLPSEFLENGILLMFKHIAFTWPKGKGNFPTRVSCPMVNLLSAMVWPLENFEVLDLLKHEIKVFFVKYNDLIFVKL